MIRQSRVLACLDCDELDILGTLSDNSDDEEELIDEDSQSTHNSDDPSETSADEDANTSSTIEIPAHIPTPSPPSPLVVTRKRKRKNRVAKGPFFFSDTLTTNTDWQHSEPEPSSKTITYVLSIVSSTEIAKKPTKHVSIGCILQLSSSEPWDTIRAQLLAQIDDAIEPRPLDLSNFDISFTISRVVVQALPLQTEQHYKFLLGEAMKGKTVAQVKVLCEQKVLDTVKVCAFNYSPLHGLVTHIPE
jgi:hypothetical protein